MRGTSRCAGAAGGGGAVLVLTLATLTAAVSAPVGAQNDTALLGVDTNLEPYEFCAHEGSTCSCNGIVRWGYTGGDAPNQTQWVRRLFTALGDLAPHTTRGVLCTPRALFDCISLFPRNQNLPYSAKKLRSFSSRAQRGRGGVRGRLWRWSVSEARLGKHAERSISLRVWFLGGVACPGDARSCTTPDASCSSSSSSSSSKRDFLLRTHVTPEHPCSPDRRR